MGRRPIHDEAMSPAERQRRRRERLRTQPWRDPRAGVRAILHALRELQGAGEQAALLNPELLAHIVDRAVAQLAPEDDGAKDEARQLVANLLDPAVPLPERGHRGRRGGRGHRLGERRRRRHGSGTEGHE